MLNKSVCLTFKLFQWNLIPNFFRLTHQGTRFQDIISALNFFLLCFYIHGTQFLNFFEIINLVYLAPSRLPCYSTANLLTDGLKMCKCLFDVLRTQFQHL